MLAFNTFKSFSVQELTLRCVILFLICVLAFCVRLFAVIRYESIIHEYDPWFNYRSTQQLVLGSSNKSIAEVVYNFWNWFDETSWYPLSRNVGSTLYPGLMFTSAIIYWVLNALSFTINIRNVCVMLAPFFASLTCLSTYLIVNEIYNSKSAGLLGAAFISIVPGYISRSVAGSYDNECISIFAMIFTLFLWIRSVKTGSIFWSTMAALSYFYMTSAWGGYVFIINIIPLHVLSLIATNQFENSTYIAYCTFYVIGTILSMQIRIINIEPVKSSEHQLALGTFGLIQIYSFFNHFKNKLSPKSFSKFMFYFVIVFMSSIGVVLFIGHGLDVINPFTGRFYSLLNPTHAKKNTPIIASVSEHQPTVWSTYYFDLNILIYLILPGLYFSIQSLDGLNLFAILYGVVTLYFSAVMIRLMLVLTPAVCILGSFSLSRTLKTYIRLIRPPPYGYTRTISKGSFRYAKSFSVFLLAGAFVILAYYVLNCNTITSEAYSSPSVILSARYPDGRLAIIDDFREAYWWLRQNSRPDAKIMSWWDYGYQIAGIANRSTIVDNHTSNFTHIAIVGTAMSSSEEESIKYIRMLDADYVLVVFGGMSGYSSDDVNKFLWMVRIGGSYFSQIEEADYLSKRGEYRIDAEGSEKMLNCLLYKLCYYRFGNYRTHRDYLGYDFVRNVEIGNKNVELKHFEEVFTSNKWIVRIYKVNPPSIFGD